MNNSDDDSSKDCILIVDDDPIICEVLSMALEDYFNLKSVNSGEECLAIVDSYQPKLIILDIEMPGINGY
jgi:CheY-like chemotaxis protein